MDTPDFMIEYKPKHDNHELRIFLAVLKNKSYSYELAKKFRGYKKTFGTELIEENKISSNVKKMRERGDLHYYQKGKPIVVWSNKDLLKNFVEEPIDYDIDKAIDMFTDITDKLGLAFNPRVKNLRDCLDIILYYLWDICLNEEKILTPLSPYSPIVVLLTLTPYLKETGNVEIVPYLDSKVKKHFKFIPGQNPLEKYLLKNYNYFQDFLLFIADCLESIEKKHIKKGTGHKTHRLLIAFQVSAVKVILKNFKDYESMIDDLTLSKQDD